MTQTIQYIGNGDLSSKKMIIAASDKKDTMLIKAMSAYSRKKFNAFSSIAIVYEGAGLIFGLFMSHFIWYSISSILTPHLSSNVVISQIIIE